MKYLVGRFLVVALLAAAMAGCGALRSLTTKHIDFDYAISSPINLTSPVAGSVVTTSSVRITGDLVNKFDKYHGGIDWAALAYDAQASALNSGNPVPNVHVKFYASLTAPTGSFPNIQIPSDAVLLEETSLSNAVPHVSKDALESDSNSVLRDYLDKILKENTGGDKTVYLYFDVNGDQPGGLRINSLSVRGRAHGSLF